MKFTVTVERNWVNVWGLIWQPGIGPCGLRINLRPYDLENIGKATRENVDRWLRTNAGDFSQILDFYAVVGKVVIPWQEEENEFLFLDAMDPCYAD